MIPTSAAAVAAHLTRLAAGSAEEPTLPPARLHKLLCLCQGWHLAWYAEPLFAETVRWAGHGPEVDGLTDPPTDLTPDHRDAVEQVWANYRRYSADGLRECVSNLLGADHPAGEVSVAQMSDAFGRVYAKLTGDVAGGGRIDPNGRTYTLDELKQVLGL
jgi:uncharacterized phage-associated protein